jgi:hypothetical protein
MLGEPDPLAMLEAMDERTFQGWLTYWKAEPFGPVIDHRMLARIAASNAMSPGEEDDFIPRVIEG